MNDPEFPRVSMLESSLRQRLADEQTSRRKWMFWCWVFAASTAAFVLATIITAATK